ncbi:MAG: hypothetical protein ACXADH_03430, partial [Candidatus Kariarchaeaceae archaeon]
MTQSIASITIAVLESNLASSDSSEVILKKARLILLSINHSAELRVEHEIKNLLPSLHWHRSIQ